MDLARDILIAVITGIVSGILSSLLVTHFYDKVEKKKLRYSNFRTLVAEVMNILYLLDNALSNDMHGFEEVSNRFDTIDGTVVIPQDYEGIDIYNRNFASMHNLFNDLKAEQAESRLIVEPKMQRLKLLRSAFNEIYIDLIIKVNDDSNNGFIKEIISSNIKKK